MQGRDEGRVDGGGGRRIGRTPETSHIRAGRQIDPQFVLVPVFLVVLRYPLAHLGRCHPDNGVPRRIESWLATEYLDAQHTLFQGIPASLDGLLHHVAEQVRIAAAVSELGASQEPLHLAQNRLLVSWRQVDHLHRFLRTGHCFAPRIASIALGKCALQVEVEEGLPLSDSP